MVGDAAATDRCGVRFRVARVVLPSRPILALAGLAAAPSLVAWPIALAVGLPDLFNDFHSYWYAARLLTEGASPYDLDALRDLAARHGDVFVLGTGYSYPLPFAIAMVPLATLPFEVALGVFNGLSIVVFAAAVAGWLSRFHAGADESHRRLAALLCGACPPVIGSVLNGQVNLLILAAVALGAALVTAPNPRHNGAGGLLIGLAAVVKLVPGVLLVPLWLANARRAALGLVAGGLVPLAVAITLLPAASLDSARLGSLFRPDPFVTNQSINGFVSRLVVSSDRMTALAPGAFDAAVPGALLTTALAVATLAVLWRGRAALGMAEGLSLAVALGLVAATIGAPKTSLWNTSLVLVAIGLLVASTARHGAPGGLDRLEQRLLVGWWAGSFLQPLVWLIPPQPAGAWAGLVVVLGSVALYCNVALWWLVARRLLHPAPATQTVRAGLVPA